MKGSVDDKSPTQQALLEWNERYGEVKKRVAKRWGFEGVAT